MLDFETVPHFRKRSYACEDGSAECSLTDNRILGPNETIYSR